METIELLKELIRIDSSTVEGGNEAVQYCRTYLESHGIQCETLSFNGIHSMVASIGQGEKNLVLNGHVDVVSAHQKQFEPYIEGDRLYGRGAADMKGGVVPLLNTLVRLKDEPIGCQVTVHIVSDEEVGGFNGTKKLAENGYHGDFVICTEPTGMTFSIESKGFMRLDIITHGKAAHGSRPWEGENAVIKAIDEFKEIERLEILNRGSKYYKSSSVNLAISKAGNEYNKVPDEHMMGLDIRYIPDIDPQEIIEAIRNTVSGEVKVVTVEPAIQVSTDSPYVQQLRKIIIDETGLEDVECHVHHGSSDLRFYCDKGIPAIEVGPIGDNWHGPDEYVSIKSVLQLEEIIVSFARWFS